MKRTFTDASHLSAKAESSCSFSPLSTTQLTLTFNPSEAHASIASRTRLWVDAGRRVMREKTSASSESREMLTESTPEAASASTSLTPSDRDSSFMPFVVRPSDFTPGLSRLMAEQMSTRSLRKVGSPPVSRTLDAPARANTLMTRSTSFVVSNSWDGVRSEIPSAGMQYLQRRLHLSVSDTRR